LKARWAKYLSYDAIELGTIKRCRKCSEKAISEYYHRTLQKINENPIYFTAMEPMAYRIQKITAYGWIYANWAKFSPARS